MSDRCLWCSRSDCRCVRRVLLRSSHQHTGVRYCVRTMLWLLANTISEARLGLRGGATIGSIVEINSRCCSFLEWHLGIRFLGIRSLHCRTLTTIGSAL